MSSVRHPSYGGAKFWLLIIDDATRMCWSTFLKQKSDKCERVIRFIKNLRAQSYPVNYIQCDNAGENQVLQQQCDREILNVKFEFTGPDTPQYNGKIERRFATLDGRVRAILNEAKVPEEMQNKLWAEACNHATNIEYKLVNVGCNTSAYKQFYKQKPPPLCPHQFGELAVVRDTDHIKGKMQNIGNTCMFVGETDSHSNKVYKFLNKEIK